MKILLIYPYCLEDRIHTEEVSSVPIGLYYVGAFLKENHYDVEILNWHDINKTPQKIKETLIVEKPDIIGFSILHANRWGAIEIARIAKQLDLNVKIVFGGVGATFLWKHLLTYFKEVDFVVTGEGEYTFLNLVKCFEKDRHCKTEYKNIKGIAFRKGGEVIKNKSADKIQNLDELPIPAKYFTYQHVALTRGCPGNCTFCGSPRLWGQKVRFHSADYFIKQIELLYEKGVTFFYFSDDTFTFKKDLVIEICKKILEKDLKIVWAAISRVNYISEELLYWMRKAGCIQISYGVESGSEKIRDLLNKNIKTDQIKRAFALTTKYGVLARAYFIYGCPGENWDTIQETIDLIHEIKPLGAIFYILDIFPGTALYSDFKKKAGQTDNVWLKRVEDILYFETDPALSTELILAFGKKLRTDFHENLSGFADEFELVDDKELYKMHSDFCSRLAMTFDYGDYSGIEAVKDKEGVAERLYQKSLSYYPDHRAYLGLGIINQKKGLYEKSINIFSDGIENFPDSEQLHICLGISYMNAGKYNEAISYFQKFKGSEQARYYMQSCYNALG
ncbi:MAG: radical SAM protein [Deltaproteobacteria bacterium]|nr:radical SAM protein [Deltaproteobacteria bacterium]